jgi:N-acetylmuramic acid 6-phosphate etherase
MNFTKKPRNNPQIRTFEKMSVAELLSNINQEDKTVPFAVEKHCPKLSLVTQIVARNWEVDFYIGAGTSGRLGVVDASGAHLLLGAL